MHTGVQPDDGGWIRAARPRATRRALSFAASVALVSAAVVAGAAPSASASGSYEGITSCTSYDAFPFQQPAEQQRVIFVPYGSSGDAFIILEGRFTDNNFYWWEVRTVDGVTERDGVESLNPSVLGYNFSFTNDINTNNAGVVRVYEFFGIGNFDSNNLSGAVRLGDPLCSVTFVFANVDGSDPRPAPPAPPGPPAPRVDTPVSAPKTSVGCEPMPAAAGATVTCTVTGGDPGIDILWRASYNPVFAEAGVTLGADGSGTFSFVVPAAARGEEVMVELVEWTSPMSLGVADGVTLVPTSIPAGEGRGAPAGPLAVTVALALVAGMVVRRRAFDLVG